MDTTGFHRGHGSYGVVGLVYKALYRNSPLCVCLNNQTTWGLTHLGPDGTRLKKCSSQALKAFVSMLALWSMEIIDHRNRLR